MPVRDPQSEEDFGPLRPSAALDDADADGDGVPASLDPDDNDPNVPDGDSVPPEDDDIDTDGDGVPDHEDPDPNDPNVPNPQP